MTGLTQSSEESAAAHKMQSGTSDVVFTFSYETWTDAQSRGMMRPPDRILGTLMSSSQVGKLLVANPFRWFPSAAARRLLGRERPFPTSPTQRLHTPLTLGRADPLEPDAVSRRYRAYDRSLRRAATSLGLDTPAMITTSPIVAGYAPLDWTSNVTYFGRDDWLSSPAREEYWPVYRRAYQRIADSGMVVTAVSEQIMERISPRGPHAVVRNGVEPAEWQGERPAPPAWFDAIPAPRATYVGTIDSRVDVEGIHDLARRRPDLHIVLLGPLPDASYISTLRPLSNVHVRSSVGRDELVSVLRNSELCLLAHRRTPLTRAMSPLKVYEYLAAGVPVIATDLPPVRDLGDQVILVQSVSDFADVVDEALALGTASEEARLRFVDENSWASRHTAILNLALGASSPLWKASS